ncbi:hypothetical protein [Acetivibrio cellulolyticus]|uniref:hypothetical protein n=1 Tax=Acetivibrio cellulolyticus TaxID=35830 RepID=UPI0001E2E72F|nr:hypothetical protein [Acetivibrio cellulolyticus]
MKVTEFAQENKKTMLLLPGTACSWEINFGNVLGELKKNYHLICVNYDGFDGDATKEFSNMLDATEKIEDYIIEHHGGKVDGAYGSSLGGSFVGLLIQRNRIHINHGIIGSSDLDQTGKIAGKIQTNIIAGLLHGSGRNEWMFSMFCKMLKVFFGMERDLKNIGLMVELKESMKIRTKKTVFNEFYTDLITPLNDNIEIPGTKVHVIYALKMGPKYEKRYHRHFADVDLRKLDMQHEAWMFDSRWVEPVMNEIKSCMEAD